MIMKEKTARGQIKMLLEKGFSYKTEPLERESNVCMCSVRVYMIKMGTLFAIGLIGNYIIQTHQF